MEIKSEPPENSDPNEHIDQIENNPVHKIKPNLVELKELDIKEEVLEKETIPDIHVDFRL